MSAVIPATVPTSARWRTALLALAVLLLAVLVLYRETATAMVGIWQRSETFAHAWLVLPITLWLVWRQREGLARMTPRPQPWVLLPMVVIALGWLLGDLVVVNAATQYALVALLVLSVPLVLGLDVARAILFPLMYLFFAVPFGEFMVPTMMVWTADFTVAALRLSGIPVYREGLQFIIPSGHWSVVEACSGARYLIASFTVGTLFAYLNYRSYRRRALFMLVALLVPIVANWLRAYMIVMLGHLSGNTIAVGVDHLIYGWVFFGVVILIMFLIGARWSDHPAPVMESHAPEGEVTSGTRGAAAFAGVLVAAAVVLTLPLAVRASLQAHDREAGAVALRLPESLGPGWTAAATPDTPYEPVFIKPSATVSARYAGAAGTVGVYIAYYRGQDEESKLVSSLNVLARSGDAVWNQVSARRATVDTPAGPLSVRSVELVGRNPLQTGPRPRLTAWKFYWIDGRFVGRDEMAKLTHAIAMLRGRGGDGASVVLWAEGEKPADSAAVLQAFARDHLANLNDLMQRARDAR